MNKQLNPDSLQFCVTLGTCGLERLLDDPFRPFVIIFNDRFDGHVAYEILDRRAIRIDETPQGWCIGLAINSMKGVKDMYRHDQIVAVLPGHDMDIQTPYEDMWYAWAPIEYDP
jgi:hypothetical protein